MNCRQEWLDFIASETARQTAKNPSMQPRSFERIFEWLDTTDFWTAPASTKFHSSFEGGLGYHCLKFAKILLDLTDKHDLQWPHPMSPVIVALLHDICKCNTYKKEKRNVKVKDANGEDVLDHRGKPKWIEEDVFVFDDSDMPMGHGAKSVILSQDFIRLYPTERLCILWHMGIENGSYSEHQGYGNACRKDITVLWTHVADRLAAIYEDQEEKGLKGSSVH